jgi:hypothetical protein
LHPNFLSWPPHLNLQLLTDPRNKTHVWRTCMQEENHSYHTQWNQQYCK